LTDGYFIKPDGTKAFFPGHVFLLEKIPWGNEVFYYIYQSYINEYSFSDFIHRNHSIKLSARKMKYYLQNIKHMVEHRVWDENFVAFWKDMTKVDTSEMLGGVPDKAFFVCYQRLTHRHCSKQLETFVKNMLKKVPNDKDDDVFGSESTHYHENSTPLSNKEMRDSLKQLADKLEKNLSSTSK